jgi:two-component system NtrC family sensor kinase
MSIQTFLEDIELEFLKEDFMKLLHSMKVGTERIREIVLSLRNFSRLDEAEFKQADIHEGINSTLMILQIVLKENIVMRILKLSRSMVNYPKLNAILVN